MPIKGNIALRKWKHLNDDIMRYVDKGFNRCHLIRICIKLRWLNFVQRNRNNIYRWKFLYQ